MRIHKISLVLAAGLITALSLAACGGDGGGGGITPPPGPTGKLKVFMTSAQHTGDFANDPFLVGADAVERADYFCNTDANKPDAGVYKALLVDTALRNSTSSDWVLIANTTYYRANGIDVVTTTGPDAVFPLAYRPLDNSIVDCGSANVYEFIVMTGVTDVSDFSTDGTNCAGWSTSAAGQLMTGTACSDTTMGFSWITGPCDMPCHIYCVEQP